MRGEKSESKVERNSNSQVTVLTEKSIEILCKCDAF